MTPVDYVWLIPALPLAAVVIIFFITRPLEYFSTREATGHTGREVAEAQEVDHATHGTTDDHGSADDHSAGHGGHGGRTPPMAMVSSIVGIVALFSSAALSLAILGQFLSDAALLKNGYTIDIYPWFSFGPLNYTIAFRVDGLTVIMLVVVTVVSALVHLYSVGYMAGDPSYARFFIELALFTFAMLILVLAANFLVLFIGWELVGLSSYLLIGFWYSQEPPPAGSELPYPPPAQVKAFLTTRLGDFGFLIGILILFANTQTFNFQALNTATHTMNPSLVTLAMVLIFCGAVGKSAQFPLHVWLPDAMAGPTPVSALIHAATMVAAGVYLVARLFPIYAHTPGGPEALLIIGYVGAFTSFFAATIALVKNDIKGVLAYSTISQLGYMFSGLAMAETNTIGMFHLFTHAFFKALLFLGSGSVIHAVGVQDMRKMGGLAKFMPWTAAAFLVATLSISGIPPLSGFWSKDPIIAAAYEQGNYIIYGFTLVTAFLTAFYMFRLFFLTFGGRGGAALGLWGGREQYRGESHPHESPWVMTLPLVILALLTIGIGIAGFFGFAEGFAAFLNGGIPVTFSVTPGVDPLTYVGVGFGVVGILVAWLMYGVRVVPADALTRNPLGAFVQRVLWHGYYLDDLYMLIIRYIALGLAGLAAGFDRVVIDGIVNGSARFVRGIGGTLRRSETGFLQNYGAALFGGAMIILIAFFIAVGVIAK